MIVLMVLLLFVFLFSTHEVSRKSLENGNVFVLDVAVLVLIAVVFCW